MCQLLSKHCTVMFGHVSQVGPVSFFCSSSSAAELSWVCCGSLIQPQVRLLTSICWQGLYRSVAASMHEASHSVCSCCLLMSNVIQAKLYLQILDHLHHHVPALLVSLVKLASSEWWTVRCVEIWCIKLLLRYRALLHVAVLHASFAAGAHKAAAAISTQKVRLAALLVNVAWPAWQTWICYI